MKELRPLRVHLNCWRTSQNKWVKLKKMYWCSDKCPTRLWPWGMYPKSMWFYLKITQFLEKVAKTVAEQKCQFESPNHLHQTTFVNLKKGLKTVYLWNVKKLFQKNSPKMSSFLWPFQKVTMSFQKKPNWWKHHPIWWKNHPIWRKIAQRLQKSTNMVTLSIIAKLAFLVWTGNPY